MSDITKKALASSLKKLLSNKELSKITIKDISDECGVKRQTFYYHFMDIYDLVEWIYTNEVIKPVINQQDTYEKWQEGFLSIFNYVLENESFIKHTYKSISREYIYEFLRKNTHELLKNVIEEESKEMKVKEEDKEFIADFYQYSLIGIIQSWIENGMKENPEDIIYKLNKILKGTLQKALNNLRYDR